MKRHSIESMKLKDLTGKIDKITRSSNMQKTMSPAAIASAVKRIRQDINITEQHGPVRILWKDGKPVA